MPRVTVEPASVEFEAELDETVMAAARRAGYRWPTVCDMLGQCGVCYVEVRSDPSVMSPLTSLESGATAVVRLRHPEVEPERLRLACQARVRGDVSLFKKGVRADS